MIPLQRYARRRNTPANDGCELCSAPLEEEHRHLVDLLGRAICCSCRACALLFEEPGAAQGRYVTIPERVLVDPSFTLDHDAWDRLHIPVELAFFFFHGALERWVAFYPSPAGAVESELPLEVFAEVFGGSALLAHAKPDVDALLIRAGRATDCLLVPIDACYRLIAELRLAWRGIDGGGEVRAKIDAFFDQLRRKGAAA